MAENIISGRKFRQKKGNNINVYSFWGLLHDVYCDDGVDAQTKINNIETQLTSISESFGSLLEDES